MMELGKVDNWDLAIALSQSALEAAVREVFWDHYREFYTTIVPHFAQHTYDELTSRSRNLMDDWINLANAWIEEYAGFAIRGISRTVQRKFAALLLRLRSEHALGPRQMARLVSQYIPRLSEARALVWTRTELITGSNFGSFTGARSSSLRLDKVWSTSLDGRERPWHNAANRQRRGMEEYYVVGGERLLYPAHPDASMRNRINCRCANLYVPLDH
jgi:hypothetical protein